MASLCYKRLWKLLIDKDLKKCDLQKKASLSLATMAKLSKNKNITAETLARICTALECSLDDIAEVINEQTTGASDEVF